MLEPRNVGQIISDSADTLRKNFWLFAIAVFPLCIFEFLARESSSVLMAKMMTLLDPEKLEASGDLPVDELIQWVAFLPVAMGVQILFVVLINAIGIVGTKRLLKGEATERTHLWKGALVKVVPLTLTMFLAYFIIVVVMVIPPSLLIGGAIVLESPVMAVIAGLFSLIFVLVSAIWLTLRWLLVSHVVILEDLSFFKALKRSAKLLGPVGVPFTENPKLRLGALLLIFLLISSTLQSAFIIPLLINGMSQNPPMSDMSVLSLSLPVGIITALGQVFTGAIVFPFSAIMTTNFYYDVCIRYEGFDTDDLHST